MIALLLSLACSQADLSTIAGPTTTTARWQLFDRLAWQWVPPERRCLGGRCYEIPGHWHHRFSPCAICGDRTRTPGRVPQYGQPAVQAPPPPAAVTIQPTPPAAPQRQQPARIDRDRKEVERLREDLAALRSELERSRSATTHAIDALRETAGEGAEGLGAELDELRAEIAGAAQQTTEHIERAAQQSRTDAEASLGQIRRQMADAEHAAAERLAQLAKQIARGQPPMAEELRPPVVEIPEQPPVVEIPEQPAGDGVVRQIVQADRDRQADRRKLADLALLILAGGAGAAGVPTGAVVAWKTARAVAAWRRRRRAAQAAATAEQEAAAGGGGFRPATAAIPRDTTEAAELLQLSRLEGRDPIRDALIGRLTQDELANESDSDGQLADYARRLIDRITTRANEIMPLSVATEG